MYAELVGGGQRGTPSRRSCTRRRCRTPRRRTPCARTSLDPLAHQRPQDVQAPDVEPALPRPPAVRLALHDRGEPLRVGTPVLPRAGADVAHDVHPAGVHRPHERPRRVERVDVVHLDVQQARDRRRALELPLPRDAERRMPASGARNPVRQRGRGRVGASGGRGRGGRVHGRRRHRGDHHDRGEAGAERGSQTHPPQYAPVCAGMRRGAQPTTERFGSVGSDGSDEGSGAVTWAREIDPRAFPSWERNSSAPFVEHHGGLLEPVLDDRLEHVEHRGDLAQAGLHIGGVAVAADQRVEEQHDRQRAGVGHDHDTPCRTRRRARASATRTRRRAPRPRRSAP